MSAWDAIPLLDVDLPDGKTASVKLFVRLSQYDQSQITGTLNPGVQPLLLADRERVDFFDLCQANGGGLFENGFDFLALPRTAIPR